MGLEYGMTEPKAGPKIEPEKVGPRPVAVGGADAPDQQVGGSGQQRQPGERVGAAWKTALLLGGSVLLGAAAMALWNRRTLAKLQEQARQSK